MGLAGNGLGKTRLTTLDENGRVGEFETYDETGTCNVCTGYDNLVAYNTVCGYAVCADSYCFNTRNGVSFLP